MSTTNSQVGAHHRNHHRVQTILWFLVVIVVAQTGVIAALLGHMTTRSQMLEEMDDHFVRQTVNNMQYQELRSDLADLRVLLRHFHLPPKDDEPGG